VQVLLRVRRFVCTHGECSRRPIAERLGEQIHAYARRTARCATELQAIGLALGGKAGVRLAQLLGLSVSAETLLRLIRSIEIPESTTPHVLGETIFALRKGETSGTLLADLERLHPLELLPDREKAPLSTWLKAHPGVQAVSRDHAGAYAEAIREVAPQAIQVAGRFHLSQNLGETLERIMRRYYPPIKQLLGETTKGTQPAEQQSPPFQRHEADKQVSQRRRMAEHSEEIRETRRMNRL